jgi:UDP-glucose 4-epimerase
MPIKDVEKKVLVTGGAGFIGSRLVSALLERKLRVKVLDFHLGPFEEKKDPNLEFIGIGNDGLHSGMTDRNIVEQAVKDVDVIYHLAINWDGHTWRHTLPLADLFNANVKGTLNLLETAKSQNVKHFLFSSSCAVYGEAKSPIVNEETVCNPETWEGDPGRAYGIMKLVTEKLCLLYFHQHGLPVTVFRIDYVFDDNEALPSSGIMDSVAKGETIKVVEGDSYTGIHVEDVVQAFLLSALNKNAYGQIFNLSNPASRMSYHELYALLIKLTPHSKSKIKLIKDPTRISSVLESAKLQKTLGWKPGKTKEDLRKAIIQNVKPQ